MPSIETLEKMSRALEIPMYQLFYDGDEKPKSWKLPEAKATKLSSKDARMLSRLGALFSQIRNRDKTLLIGIATKKSAARQVMKRVSLQKGNQRCPNMT